MNDMESISLSITLIAPDLHLGLSCFKMTTSEVVCPSAWTLGLWKLWRREVFKLPSSVHTGSVSPGPTVRRIT